MFEALLAEAAATPGVEVCGLLFGAPGAISEVRAARNVATEPTTRFEIDPAALLAAHRAARAGGPRPIGCYHSHPGGRAVPSRADADAAEAGALWLILADGGGRLWLAEPGGFRELPLRIS